MGEWNDIGQAEIITSTDRAVCIRFEKESGPVDIWCPRSCYQERTEGNIILQEVKSWFIIKNSLSGLLRITERGF